jgi:hypothetical protein
MVLQLKTWYKKAAENGFTESKNRAGLEARPNVIIDNINNSTQKVNTQTPAQYPFSQP